MCECTRFQTDQILSHHGDGAYRSHVMLILTGHNRSMATGNIHTADGVVAGWLIGVSSVVARRQQQRLLIRSYQMPIQTSTPDYSPSASAAPCVRRRVVTSGSSIENGDTVPATDNQNIVAEWQLGTRCNRSNVHQPSVRQLWMNGRASTHVNSSD